LAATGFVRFCPAWESLSPRFLSQVRLVNTVALAKRRREYYVSAR
jgi:hypothetical protein